MTNKPLPFELQPSEVIIAELKPNKSLITYIRVRYITTLLFPIILFGSTWLGMCWVINVLSKEPDFTTEMEKIPIFNMICLAFGLLTLFFLAQAIAFIWLAKLKYDKEKYWLTNKRIIAKTGMLGYSIKSVPYDRISDITISRSFIENLFNINSVRIQTLAGQFSAGSAGAEIVLRALNNPEKVAKQISELARTYKR